MRRTGGAALAGPRYPGLDVALEAFREAYRARRFTMDELDRYAAICRVQRVMRPYLKALAV